MFVGVDYRGVVRTLPHIYDRVFFSKAANGFYQLLQKKLQLKLLTGS